ncbi:hypothetical protein G9G63_09315 [Paenibacillus sp. EKM202P]|uniref:hypothetical protein n=1 Tax=unclassified Paenibacillus TaxID=185978 RepID=UPI0013EB0756|nr:MULTISPECIES: hypothetical protein [unclassified Paenibacillus]KAF6565347.1 hypothetical protein G9G63_09315 [Paenibacillus sp. EKM202P]KAF6569328.1 hypothetical protein G9G64_12780 [Paenibacillus sp. EKM207P]
MKYKIWDISNDRYLTEDESYNFGIGSDGKLYEFDFGTGGGGNAWLEKTQCTQNYGIHFEE